MIAVRAVEPSTKGTGRHGRSVGVQWASGHALEEAVWNDNSQRTHRKGVHGEVQGVKCGLLRWIDTNALVLIT